MAFREDAGFGEKSRSTPVVKPTTKKPVGFGDIKAAESPVKKSAAEAQALLSKAKDMYAKATTPAERAVAARLGDQARVMMGQAPQNAALIARLESEAKASPQRTTPRKDVALRDPEGPSKTQVVVDKDGPKVVETGGLTIPSWTTEQQHAAEAANRMSYQGSIMPAAPEKPVVISPPAQQRTTTYLTPSPYSRGGNITSSRPTTLLVTPDQPAQQTKTSGVPLFDALVDAFNAKRQPQTTTTYTAPGSAQMTGTGQPTVVPAPPADQGLVDEQGTPPSAPATADTTGVAPQQPAEPHREPWEVFEQHAQPQEVPPQEVQKSVSDYFQSIMRDVQQYTAQPDMAAIIANSLNQTLASIDRMSQEISTMFQQQMANLDPATLAALNALKETVNEQRNRLMDEMNRRGLLQSGIWLQMEDRINKNQLTAEQQMLASRLTNLQNQMLSSLMNFAQMRLQAQQQFSIAGIQAVESQAARQQQAALSALGTAVNLYGQQAEQQRWQSQQAAEQARWEAEQKRLADQAMAEFNQKWADQFAKYTQTVPPGYTAYGQQYTFPNAGQPTYEARQAAAKQQASQSKQGSLLTSSGVYSGFPGITPAIEAELGMSKEQIAQNARSAGVTNSQYISAAREVKNLDNQINSVFNQIRNGTGWGTLNQLEEAVQSYRSILQTAGINPEQYLRNVISKYTTLLHELGRG